MNKQTDGRHSERLARIVFDPMHLEKVQKLRLEPQGFMLSPAAAGWDSVSTVGSLLAVQSILFVRSPLGTATIFGA